MEDDNQQHLRYDEGDSSSDEVEVVGVLTFPQKVYDMVSRESLKAPDTVQWIQNGEAFALEHTDKLRNILKTYFGCLDIETFEEKLNLYGWEKHLFGRLEGAYYHKDFHRNRKEIVKYIGMHRHSEAEMDTGSHDDAGRKRSSPDSQSTEGSAKRQHLLTTEESDSDSEVEFLYTVPSNGTVSTVAAPTAASNTCNPQHPFSNRNNINEEHDSKLPARPNAVNSAQNTNGPNAAKVPEPQNIRPNLHDAGTSTLHVASLNNNGTNMQAVRNVSSQPSPSSFDDSKLPAGRRNKSNNKQDEHDDECMGNNVQIRNEQDDSLRSNDENNDIAASSVQTPQKSSNSTVSVSPPYTSESSEESGKEDGPSCNSSFASSSDDFSRRQHQQGVTSQQHFSLNTTHSIQDKAFSNNTQSVLSAATTTVTTNCTSTQKVTSFRLKPLNSYPERSDRTSAITEKMNDESTGNTAFNLGTEETTTDTQPTSSEVTVTSSAVASTGADSSNNGNLGGANDIAQSRCLVGNALTKMAHEIVDEFQRDQRKQQSKLLASCLREKRNAVLEKARRHTSQRPMAANSPTFRDRIPAAGNIRPTAAFIQSIKEGLCVIESKDKKTVEMSRIKLEGIPPSLPRHNAPFMINSLCGGTEEEQLSYIPYLNESEGPQDVLSQAYHIDERQKRLERGAIYEENQKNLEIDTVLKGLLSRMGMTFCQLAEGSTSKAVTKACKDATDVSEKWVRERIDLIVTAKQTAPAKSETGAEIKRNNGLPASCDPRVEDKKYLKGIDTFRSLFCNRCSVYDCDVHGSNDEVPSLTLQYELSCARKRDGYWKEINGPEPLTLTANTSTSPLKNEPGQPVEIHSKVMTLKDFQKVLCRRWFYMFEGDSSKISSALGVPEGVITSFVSSEELTLPKAVLGLKKKKTKHGYFSMKNYNKQLITAVQKDKKGELFPWCLPCTHPGTSRTASCLENTIFCTKACGQGEYNPNYFRGCNCSGSCDSNSCSCFAANRECDPDLCKACGACSDTTKLLPVSGQRCKNDNITMSRHQRLLVGISSIPGAGWGLFTKNRLKRGDFIQEYTGELIATDEADRRGVIYDEQNLSYLFDQSKEYAIDAIRKGSKARFANHSLEPNVDTKYLFVNGDFRIAFVANQNIDAQTELFIDYKYDKLLEHHKVDAKANKETKAEHSKKWSKWAVKKEW